jgi:CRP-like cAMP-binding protein
VAIIVSCANESPDALPLATFQAGETVLAAGSRTGQLLILKKGAVAIVKDGIQLARVAEPGAVFGELATLLDQPHTADVRALETSQFHVADVSETSVQYLRAARLSRHARRRPGRGMIQLA